MWDILEDDWSKLVKKFNAKKTQGRENCSD